MQQQIQDTAKEIAALIKGSSRIVALVGAGISTACGIPDFRSPGSGVYDNLGQYNLPTPMAIFTGGYFRQRPRPFFNVIERMVPEEPYKHSVTHSFLAFLEAKGKMSLTVTQNIDDLEFQAGQKKVIQAHGSVLREALCTNPECGRRYSSTCVLAAASDGAVPYCESCGHVIKPTVVLFGESVQVDWRRLQSACREADLCLVMGTSLNVPPVSRVPEMTSCPRVLVNRERVGDFQHFFQGDCDLFCSLIIKEMNAEGEFEAFRQSKLREIHGYGGFRLQGIPQGLRLIGLAGSLRVPTGCLTEVEGVGKIMLCFSSPTQIELLEQHCAVQEIALPPNAAPACFAQPNHTRIQVYTRRTGPRELYAPLLGHFSSYLTQFAEMAPEHTGNAIDAWDIATRLSPGRIANSKLGQAVKFITSLLSGMGEATTEADRSGRFRGAPSRLRTTVTKLPATEE